MGVGIAIRIGKTLGYTVRRAIQNYTWNTILVEIDNRIVNKVGSEVEVLVYTNVWLDDMLI